MNQVKYESLNLYYIEMNLNWTIFNPTRSTCLTDLPKPQWTTSSMYEDGEAIGTSHYAWCGVGSGVMDPESWRGPWSSFSHLLGQCLWTCSACSSLVQDLCISIVVDNSSNSKTRYRKCNRIIHFHLFSLWIIWYPNVIGSLQFRRWRSLQGQRTRRIELAATPTQAFSSVIHTFGSSCGSPADNILKSPCTCLSEHLVESNAQHNHMRFRIKEFSSSPRMPTLPILQNRQSYKPSCSQTSTRKSIISCHSIRKQSGATNLYCRWEKTSENFSFPSKNLLTASGIGCGKGLLVLGPSRLS